MKKSLGNLIKENRKKLKLSQDDLAAQLTSFGINVTNKAISKWEMDACEPSVNAFLVLCTILNITNPWDELLEIRDASPLSGLNSEGVVKLLEYKDLLMLSPDYRLAAKEQLSTTAPIAESLTEEASVTDISSITSISTKNNATPQPRYIRLYNLPVSAGPGEFLDGDDYETIEADELVPINADFGLRISGNSMEPMFQNGQIVWVAQCERLKNGEIGIFYLNGNAYCKMLALYHNTLSLLSFNPDYAPINVRRSDNFRIFGKVLV